MCDDATTTLRRQSHKNTTLVLLVVVRGKSVETNTVLAGYVDRLRSLVGHLHLEFDVFSVLQVSKSIGDDRRLMNEHCY